MEIHPALIPFAIVAAFTPGPNNIMIMASGLNFGWRASLPHFFGICLGFPSMFLAVGFGLGYLFNTYPLLHRAVQVIGMLYLFYLSWKIATSAPSNLDGEQVAKPLTFFQAALFQWINPKAWIMGTSAIATFSIVGADINLQIIVIAAVFMSMAFPSAGVWMIFGAALRTLLSDPRKQNIFNIAMGILLALSILPIVADMVEAF